MYGVLEGELRSCILLPGKECPLATLPAGSIFGEISLFDKGPHAADVISNQESILIKITASALSRVSKEAPDAALGLLLGLIKAIAGRVRVLTRRYEDSVHAVHTAEAVKAA
jgi:CRP-like cAMP-binding protein